MNETPERSADELTDEDVEWFVKCYGKHLDGFVLERILEEVRQVCPEVQRKDGDELSE